MSQDAEAALIVVLLVVLFLFLLIALASEPPKKTMKDSAETIRRSGHETLEDMSQVRDDYAIQELIYLSRGKAKLALSEEPSSRTRGAMRCPNQSCRDNGQQQNVRKFGRTSAGKQRYQCKMCGKTFIRR